MSNPLSLGQKILVALVALLTASAAYLYAFPQPNVVYPVVVLAHAFGGVLAALLLLVYLRSFFRGGNWISISGFLLLLAGAVPGLILIRLGALREHWSLLYTHIVLCLVAVGFLLV